MICLLLKSNVRSWIRPVVNWRASSTLSATVAVMLRSNLMSCASPKRTLISKFKDCSCSWKRPSQTFLVLNVIVVPSRNKFYPCLVTWKNKLAKLSV